MFPSGTFHNFHTYHTGSPKELKRFPYGGKPKNPFFPPESVIETSERKHLSVNISHLVRSGGLFLHVNVVRSI